MEIKCVAAAVLFFSCVAAGAWQWMRLFQRLSDIRSLQELLQLLRIEILCRCVPLSEAVARASQRASGAGLRFCLCLLDCISDCRFEEFGQAWQRAASEAALFQTAGAEELSGWELLGRQLGRGDSREQEKIMEHAEFLLRRAEEQARGDFCKKGRMYVMTGLCAGVFLTVLLF